MHAARPVLHLRTAATVLLMAVLLLAQWAGLAHRVNHSPLGALHLEASNNSTSEEGSHSCVAFDAAAVADAISLLPFAAPPMASAEVFALWTAFASWDAPLALPFSSRAPPVS
ncbi:hypothetical protein [Noviherbaspirillum sp. ST9]|uniref:hypothetical protein n=1 Tax=Noviherbaspirillum sp. ST9 TaxID=3401606 RepID=UPI003B585DD3